MSTENEILPAISIFTSFKETVNYNEHHELIINNWGNYIKSIKNHLVLGDIKTIHIAII